MMLHESVMLEIYRQALHARKLVKFYIICD